MKCIAVCDDNKTELDHLTALISAYFDDLSLEAETDGFESGEKLLSSEQPYDAYFLDILMPETNGVEIAKVLRLKYPDCAICFVTSTPDFAIEGYSVNAFNYLLKPVNQAQITKTLNELSLHLYRDAAETIPVKVDGLSIPVVPDRIIYLESVNKRVFFHMQNAPDDIYTYDKLDRFESLLNVFSQFLRCHKSYMVNMKFVEEIDGCAFVLKDGRRVPIPKDRLSSVKQRYYTYLFNEVNVW